MKQFYLTVLLMLGVAAPLKAQQSYYLISGTVSNPPPINATTVENMGNITAVNSNYFYGAVFDFLNLENFINRGNIYASPGIDFSKITLSPDARAASTSFINEQNVYADFRLLINANTVENRNGALLATPRIGLLDINAQSVDLFGGRITAGDGTTFGNVTEGSISIRRNNNFFYLNPANIRDEYWGSTNGGNISLPFMSFGGVTPSHRTFFRGTPQGNTFFQSLDVNPFFSGGSFFLTNTFPTNGYLFYASTNNFNFINNTTIRNTIQLVFIRTNEFSPDIQVAFPFSTNSAGFDVNDIVVQFGTSDVDPVTGQTFQRYLTLLDESMFRARMGTGGATDTLNLQANDDRPGYFRPLAYTLVRSDFASVIPAPVGFPVFPGSSFAVPPIPYVDVLFPGSGNFDDRFITNQVSHEYSAWGFVVSPRDFGGDLGIDPTLSDATNSPGRINISGSSSDLSYSTLVADNMISLSLTNGVDLTGATLSAPNIRIKVAGNSNTIISNNFPDNVTRLNGQVAVWTGVWQIDQRVTNTYIGGFTGLVEHAYQVMILDNTLSTNAPVVLRDFNVQSTEVTLDDTLTFGGNLLIGGNCLHIPATGSFNLNSENTDFNSTDAPNLRCLINEGTFNVPLLINLGVDRSLPYSNIVNRGSMLSGSILIRSETITNSGTLFAVAGSLGITAGSNYLEGGILGAFGGNINLAGDHLSMSNAVISAPQQLTMRFTNFFGDNGITNNIFVGSGFSLLTHPNKGDLMATRLETTASTTVPRFHVWRGENRGATPSGYANNTAIQHLVLNGVTNCQFHFQGAVANSALYVNYLEFQGGTTNTNGLHIASTLVVNPNLTIYFADSNVPEDKLTNAFPGRLVWVDPAITAGPMVAVPLVGGQYMQLTTREFQTMLAPGGDYDGDGVANDRDDSPMSGFTVSNVTLVNVPQLTAFIKWQAVKGVTYTIEYRDGLGQGNWQSLYSITAVENREITAVDLPPAGGQRFYRVRFTAQ
ncbi:MAG TPA: hypothetical protein VGH19_18750 [Verrucomicrobiae bacterium]